MTKNCDKILVFDKGRIAENGTHDELIRAGGLYKEAFYTQAKDYIS